MSYSKFTSILLYIVFGISILVIAFFYFGDKLIDTKEYEAKIEKLETPGGLNDDQFIQTPAVSDSVASADSAAVDTTMALQRTPAVEKISTPVQPVAVNLTGMEALVYHRTDIALIWAYILLVIAAIFALIFPLIGMFSSPARLIRTLIGLVIVAGILLGAYALGSGRPLSIIGYEGTDNNDPQVLKMVDMGLITMYFILGLALLSILYSEIARYFK